MELCILTVCSKLIVFIYLSESINTKTEENSTVANHNRDENLLMCQELLNVLKL